MEIGVSLKMLPTICNVGPEWTMPKMTNEEYGMLIIFKVEKIRERPRLQKPRSM